MEVEDLSFFMALLSCERSANVEKSWRSREGLNENMIKKNLIAFIEENFLFEFDKDITDETDLFKAGILDSFGYLQLINFISKTYEIEFSKQEILSNVITSLSGLVGLVESRLAVDEEQRQVIGS